MSQPITVDNTKSSQEQAHADWMNKVTTNLVQKVNPNIEVRQGKNGEGLIFSNISESDLENLQFVTNTDHNNNHGFVAGVSVSIHGNNSPLTLSIPGFSQVMIKLFNDSDSQAFIKSERFHTPFKLPFSNNNRSASLSVGDYIDMQTSLNPSLPQTLGKPKTYSIVHTPIYHNHIGEELTCMQGNPKACPPG